MTYSPWRTLRDDHPATTYLRMRLPLPRACYLPTPNVIVIDDRCDRDERRSHLAHELAHIDLEHTPQLDQRQNRRQEKAADTLAAARLITLDELASVLRWALGPDEVAAELGVTEHMVKVRVRGLTPEERIYIEQRLTDWGAA